MPRRMKRCVAGEREQLAPNIGGGCAESQDIKAVQASWLLFTFVSNYRLCSICPPYYLYFLVSAPLQNATHNSE